MRISLLELLGSVFILLSMVADAHCNALRVPEDFPTILAAVDAGVSGDSILVAPGAWTDTDDRLVAYGGAPPILVTSCAFLKGGLTIIGVSGPAATTVDGGGTAPNAIDVFSWSNEPLGNVTIEGFTITGANARGIHAVNCGQLTVRNCRVVNNEFITTSGKGIRFDDCNLVALDSEISWNTMADTGTGILGMNFFSAEVRRCRFEGNDGGGLTLIGDNMTVTDCTFVGNRDDTGGGFSAGGGGSLVLERNMFLRNISLGNLAGGGGASIGSVSATIRFNTFALDSCLGNNVGGGINFPALAVAFVSQNTFFGCHAYSTGSAVAASGGSEVNFAENVVSFSTGPEALRATSTAIITGGCNVLWQNVGGNYSEHWTPLPNDAVADPLFCDPSSLEFSVSASSPCVPGAIDGCGQIGAWGIGCGPIAVEATSWGRIKGLYR